MAEAPKPEEGSKEENITQQEFLQGRRIEVEYRGPIEISIPNKQLLVLSPEDFGARYDGGTFPADFIFVDPARFNISKFRDLGLEASGHKELRQGEVVTLGRESPLRFPDLSPAVSREHLRLEVLDDGKIAIEDRSSTNGTVVRYPKAAG